MKFKVSNMSKIDRNHYAVFYSFPAASLHCDTPLLGLPVLLSFRVTQGQKSINIPQEISTHYRTFGIHLLNDHTGAIVDGIVHKYREDSLQINIEILQRWIRGEGGKPVSWETLTDCLRDTGLSELADDIRQALANS